MVARLDVRLRLSVGLLLAGCAASPAPVPAQKSAPRPGDPLHEIRREGEPCGGYPAPGEALTECADGLVCDYEGEGVDAPGRCKRR